MKHRRLLLTLLLTLSCTAAPLAQADVEALNVQAAQLYQQGKYTQALEPARQALAEAESVFGAEHPQTANSLNNLAALLQVLGRYHEASPCTSAP